MTPIKENFVIADTDNALNAGMWSWQNWQNWQNWPMVDSTGVVPSVNKEGMDF